jgi:hypothetical protein
MGNVNFNTLVAKTVDIDKVVNLNVNKDVFASVDVEGNLATAEASADAIGGGGGVGTPPQFGSFRIDDFDEDQAVVDVVGGGGTSSNQIIPTAGVLAFGAPDDTNIPASANRELFIEVLGQVAAPGATGEVDTTSPQDILNVAFNPQAFGNAYVQYTSNGGAAYDITPLVDNNQIEANAADGVPDDFISITIGSFNPGDTAAGDPATARVSIIFEDNDGDIALASAVLTDGFSSPITIPSPLAGYLNESGPGVPPPGTPVPGSGGDIVGLGFEDDADGDGNIDGGVDFDNITSITLVIEDRPGQTPGLPGGINTTDFFDFNVVVPEEESVTGTDLQVDLAEVNTFLPGVPGEGNLAETDTFAQVSPEGAFSFSESLAATDGFDFG